MPINVKIVKKVGGGGGGQPDKSTLKFKSNASTSDWPQNFKESITIDGSSDASGCLVDEIIVGNNSSFSEQFGIEAGIVYEQWIDPVTHEEFDDPIITIVFTADGWTDPGHATVYIPEGSYDGRTAMFIDGFLDDTLGIVDSVIPPTGPGIYSLVFSISPEYGESSTFPAYRSGNTFYVNLEPVGTLPTYTISAPVATAMDGSTITDIWFVNEGTRTKMDSAWSLQIPDSTEGTASIEATVGGAAVTAAFSWSNYGSM